MNFKGNFLTEKGNLKPAARTAILAEVSANPAVLGTAEFVEQGVYTIAVNDAEGHTVYVNVDLSVSTMHPADRKKPVKKDKAPKEPESFTLEA